MILCVTLSDSIKILPTNCEEGLFYSRQQSKRTLVARTDFRKFKKFSLQICYLKILINIAKSLVVMKRTMFQFAIGENRIVVTPKMTLIETF